MSTSSYCTAIYLRVSKDDGDLSSEKTESNSIANQRMLLQEYIHSLDVVTDTVEYCDDGYTGTNFQRPAFIKMMEDVIADRIQCIVVKDLSRFGREYIDVGRYLQKVFPALGVRFIAVTDGYDSLSSSGHGDFLSLVVRNLMNEAYSRDISTKVRSALEAKRQAGSYVGNFAPYGYQKSKADGHKLIPDPEAAQVVQHIFHMKIAGSNPQQIAAFLNQNKVLSPLEYKKAKGISLKTPFQREHPSEWSAVAIHRILKNPVYTGILLQGKRTTPNYKVKKTITKPSPEWVRTENAHEAIISSALFELVQGLMQEDTRIQSGKDTVPLFSGKLFCGECHSPMVCQMVRYRQKQYIYVVCSSHKQHLGCPASHRIRESSVAAAVWEILRCHASLVMEEAFLNSFPPSLDRSLISLCIDRIFIHQDSTLEIRLLYNDPLAASLEKEA